MKYFRLWYRLCGEDRYLIWISNDRDAVVVDDAGFVLCFDGAEALRAYADRNGYKLEAEDPILHDLDAVATWLDDPRMPVNCNEVLAAWNLFSDVARSVHERGSGFESLDSRFPAVYEKLFWGNNLPSMTPSDRRYTPEWSPEEVAALSQVLRTGLGMFRSSGRPFQQQP